MLCAEVLKEQVSHYMQQLHFPQDACTDLSAALAQICADDASFAAAGLVIAGEVIRDLCQK